MPVPPGDTRSIYWCSLQLTSRLGRPVVAPGRGGRFCQCLHAAGSLVSLGRPVVAPGQQRALLSMLASFGPVCCRTCPAEGACVNVSTLQAMYLWLGDPTSSKLSIEFPTSS